MGGATTKVLGGHKWNKFGKFGWRNIERVRPNREGVDIMQKISQGPREIYFWSEKHAIKRKIRIFKRKSIVLDK